MQVKKFEAPTIQEALDTIKRELGPEAIILQTKKHRRGFGLLSKSSFEVTAAVSERALTKKNTVERKIPEGTREQVKKLPATRQVEMYEKYLDGKGVRDENVEARLDAVVSKTKDQVQISNRRAAAAAQLAAAAAQVSAAVSERTVVQRQLSPKAAQQGMSAAEATKKITQTRYIDIPDAGASANVQAAPANTHLEREIQQLKKIVSDLKVDKADAKSAANGMTTALQDAYDLMVFNGIEKRYGVELIKRVQFELGEKRSGDMEEVFDQLATELMMDTQTTYALDGIMAKDPQSAQAIDPVILALMGPTGVGKTTTLAKIAGRAITSKGLKVGLINLDTQRAGSFDQLATFAKILNVPFRAASSPEDLLSAVSDLKGVDLILIDTVGSSQRNPESLKKMEQMLQVVPQIQTQLVLSAITRDSELYDQANRFSIFRPQGLIFSKLDEATMYGSIYNLQQKTKLPLFWFTTGQKVPEDLEAASKERVVALVMDL
ncbi:flagellar biosynthesis protein FlhF [bacterium]|jgi:flagellar biosynthesis protein FlhF|nr:flagellar biosynthesis protein FlhF [bacterium]